VRRKLPSELSKKCLLRDNSDMISKLHEYKNVIETQLIANIELEVKLVSIKKEIAKLRNKL